jgi:F0F1-type ATP synthase gamma subunit
MMGVALIQVIMESKLAQYAARFNAMNSAKHRATDLVTDFNLQYHRAKRAEGDERLKEIIKIVRHHQKGLA